MTINLSLFTGETSVVLVGNPGVGKSAILNALGGGFKTGFGSVSGLTRELSTSRSIVNGRKLRLVDIPGIYDFQLKDEYATQRHLEILQNALNDGSSYIIFFVIAPNNGRISPSDFAVMKTLLDNLDSSPLVGLILNQVRRKDYDAIQSSGYFEKVQSVLRESKANLKYFSAAGPLVIMDYDDNNYDDSNDDYDKGFNSAAITAIKSYVLSFEPTPVIVRRLFASTYMVVLTVLAQIVYAAVGM